MKLADARVWRALPPSSSLRNSCDERTALLYCLRFDGGMLLDVVACARIERTRRKCIGQETRRPFRLLFVATQSLHILRNMVHRVAKAAENMLRCRLIGTSPILLPQKRGVAPQKQRALRIWGRRRTLQQRGEQKKKTFGGALAATTPRPRSALVSQSARMYSRCSPRTSHRAVGSSASSECVVGRGARLLQRLARHLMHYFVLEYVH